MKRRIIHAMPPINFNVGRHHHPLSSTKMASTCLILLSTIIQTTSSENGECSGSSETCSKNALHEFPECGVFVAPSTLGDFTNLGIFTGKDLAPNEVVNYPEIAIPLMFRDWNERPWFVDDDSSLWDRYIWEGDIADIESYEDADRSRTRTVFMPGIGCMVNSILDMNNIDSAHGSVYDTASVSRSDPGSGAFAPYHLATTTTTRHITLGSELFASYGATWIPSIPNVAVTQNEYLDGADEFLETYYEWIQKIESKYAASDGFTPPIAESLWRLVSQKIPAPTSNIMSVLPKEEWHVVQQKLSKRRSQQTRATDDNKQSDSVSRNFIEQQSQRSLEWLQEHGRCQDHMRPGISEVPSAGRGAFATRKLPKNTILGYAPLIHVGEKAGELWNIEYQSFNKTDLIINYSFGHRNSTLMLTPYGGMVNYINHHLDPSRINARIQWPSKELVAHKPEWLTRDVSYLRNTHDKIGLSFDYVALRDIQEGEEIFIDYGQEWQKAWEEHVKMWQPPADAQTYVHSSQYGLDYFRTQEELADDPYPQNLHAMCIESFQRMPEKSHGESSVSVTAKFLPVLRKTDKRVHCAVLSRADSSSPDSQPTYKYVVELHLASGERVVVSDYDHSAIFLYDKAFSQDWHLQGAFRQKMFVPDHIWPTAWNNLG